MAGTPTESPLVLRESLGSSHNHLTSAEDYGEALLSGYPPVGLFDAKNVYHAEQKGNRLPRPCRLPRPERRGLRSPWGQSAGSRISYTLATTVAAPRAHKPTTMLTRGTLRYSKITYTARAINP